MKGHYKLALTALLILLAVLPVQSFAKDMVAKEPPKSLDKLYPPVNKEQKWVQQMHKISGHFGGVFVDMGEQDWENAEKHAARFVESYKEAADMVPEWKDYFDHESARKFAEEVKTRDAARIGKAAGPVGKTCGKCHDDQYLSVWTRYHWPSADKIAITDPVDEKELKYGKYMSLLSGAFKGVTVNFGEGQYDRAKKALGGFKKRFMELKSVCSKCHTGDAVKQFYVGEASAQAFDGMEAELNSPKPNPGNFWKHVGTLGYEGCKKCHLTHRAYAIVQEIWEEKEEARK
ncbi:MAG: cytochrome c [Nitrospinae bacterium]|nr:cytochrome c [Nitrospinota bacterium]